MLLILLAFSLVLLAVFVFGVLVGHAGRERLRLELANLRGKHDTLAEAYQHMREIAAQALAVARARHFPAQMINPEQHEQLERQFNFQSVVADPDPFRVENCPKCAWSCRASEWPVTCKVCGTVFGDEWPDVVE
jgi:hypothetical protein